MQKLHVQLSQISPLDFLDDSNMNYEETRKNCVGDKLWYEKISIALSLSKTLVGYYLYSKVGSILGNQNVVGCSYNHGRIKILQSIPLTSQNLHCLLHSKARHHVPYTKFQVFIFIFIGRSCLSWYCLCPYSF